MIPDNWLEEAASRIAPYIRRTPLYYDPEQEIYLKWENHQITGSFKARGALNKVLTLQPWERQRGLVAASAGNHGQGVALAGKITGATVVVFASEHATPNKVSAMQSLGAEVRLVAGDYGEAERAGLAYAKSSGMTWVSPYNDGQVIAGQGTLGVEILEELPDLPQSAFVVPVGGGGLIAGIGAAIKSPGTAIKLGRRVFPKLVGVQSEASPFAYALYHQGTQEGVVELPSLADGLAGPVESNSLTIPLMKRYVDDFVLVSEGEIAEAVAYAWNQYQEKVEGSAAAALAAVIHQKVPIRPAVVILSGGNIQPELHRELAGRSSHAE